MPETLSKEAELKNELQELKAKLSGAEQANIVLSKQAGSNQGELEKLADVKEERTELKKELAAKDAEIGRLQAEVESLQAQAKAAEGVLAVAKDLKSLLSKV